MSIPRKITYRGFSIEREFDSFAVRYHQTNPELTHDWKPWLDSVEEAKAVVDKIIDRLDKNGGDLLNA